MKMTIKENENDVCLVTVEGDLDYHAANDLRSGLNELLEKKPKKVLINLAAVTYIDSTGLAVFVEVSQTLQSYGGKLAFIHLSDTVSKIFSLAKMHLFFKLAESEQDALTHLTS